MIMVGWLSGYLKMNWPHLQALEGCATPPSGVGDLDKLAWTVQVSLQAHPVDRMSVDTFGGGLQSVRTSYDAVRILGVGLRS